MEGKAVLTSPLVRPLFACVLPPVLEKDLDPARRYLRSAFTGRFGILIHFSGALTCGKVTCGKVGGTLIRKNEIKTHQNGKLDITANPFI